MHGKWHSGLRLVTRTSAAALVVSAVAVTWGSIESWGPDARAALARAGRVHYGFALVFVISCALHARLESRSRLARRRRGRAERRLLVPPPGRSFR